MMPSRASFARIFYWPSLGLKLLVLCTFRVYRGDYSLPIMSRLKPLISEMLR